MCNSDNCYGEKLFRGESLYTPVLCITVQRAFAAAGICVPRDAYQQVYNLFPLHTSPCLRIEL